MNNTDLDQNIQIESLLFSTKKNKICVKTSFTKPQKYYEVQTKKNFYHFQLLG